MYDLYDCINYDNNKKLGLLQFQSGYGQFYLNSPKGYSRKIINAQTELYTHPKYAKLDIGAASNPRENAVTCNAVSKHWVTWFQ